MNLDLVHDIFLLMNSKLLNWPKPQVLFHKMSPVQDLIRWTLGTACTANTSMNSTHDGAYNKM